MSGTNHDDFKYDLSMHFGFDFCDFVTIDDSYFHAFI